MTMLAIDTSTRWMGLALYDGAAVLSEVTWETHNRHTVELAPAIHALLQRSAKTPAELTSLAVALGPGSFTSLRIGLAAVKGMALALRLPLVGVPTLDILAAAQPFHDELPLAAVLQAGRGRLAVQWYTPTGGRWLSQGDAEVMTIDELNKRISRPTIVCGEINAEGRQLLERRRKHVHLANPANCIRRPALLAELAWSRVLAHQVDDPVTLSPIYLHVQGGIPD